MVHVRFASFFYNQAVFQKSERSFFENHPLMAELKFKMSQN